MPKNAVNHIQNTAPGPPIAIAIATPSTSHAQKTIKTDVKPSNSAEPDIENQTPEATVQIKVTQKPFAVNELK